MSDSSPTPFVPRRSRGYSWQPFAEGNLAAVRHGARSPRVVGGVARQLADALLEERPDLERFPEAVAAWARAEARCCLLAAWQEDNGWLGDDGVPKAAADTARFERAAADARVRLGLDPKSEADLLKARGDAAAIAVDLDAIRARGREALARRPPGDVDR